MMNEMTNAPKINAMQMTNAPKINAMQMTNAPKNIHVHTHV
jgi:hypothetical protein